MKELLVNGCRILNCDALAGLQSLPADSVNCIVTSPPYWGLRDYGIPPVIFGGDATCEHVWDDVVQPAANGILHDGGMGGQTLYASSATRKPKRSSFCLKCNAWRGQLGLEPTFWLFLDHMVEIFEECRRVLRRDGTCWLNMGDSYSASGAVGSQKGKQATNRGSEYKPGRRQAATGLKKKELIGQPWRLAFALQEAGWYLRSDIIWHKPNPMPESVRDRPTRAHEFIFLLTKSPKYFYDPDAIAEPCSPATHARCAQNVEATIKRPDGWDTAPGAHGTIHRKGRGKGETVAKQGASIPDHRGQNALDGCGGPNSHFRVNHQTGNSTPSAGRGVNPKAKLAEVRGSASDRFGREAGGRAREKQNASFSESFAGKVSTRNSRTVWTIGTEPFKDAHFAVFPTEIPRRCILAGCIEGGIMLDPFAGSFTTGAVARELGHEATLIELSPSYVEIGIKRLLGVTPGFGVFGPTGIRRQ